MESSLNSPKIVKPSFAVIGCAGSTDAGAAFSRMVDYFRENGLKLVGAVQEFTDPKTQQEYLYFPIRAL